MGDRPFSLAFPRLYNMSSLKNCFVSDVLVWSENSVSFSFGLNRALSNRETAEVVSLLSLIEGFDFSLGEGMFVFGAPILWKGFLESLSFGVWLIPLP